MTVRLGKVCGRTPNTYEGRKSDEVIVVQKQTNNSEQYTIVGFDAEYVEATSLDH